MKSKVGLFVALVSVALPAAAHQKSTDRLEHISRGVVMTPKNEINVPPYTSHLVIQRDQFDSDPLPTTTEDACFLTYVKRDEDRIIGTEDLKFRLTAVGNQTGRMSRRSSWYRTDLTFTPVISTSDGIEVKASPDIHVVCNSVNQKPTIQLFCDQLSPFFLIETPEATVVKPASFVKPSATTRTSAPAVAGDVSNPVPPQPKPEAPALVPLCQEEASGPEASLPDIETRADIDSIPVPRVMPVLGEEGYRP